MGRSTLLFCKKNNNQINNLKINIMTVQLSNKFIKVLKSLEPQTTEIKKEINRLKLGIDTYNSLTKN
tara:strand:- start:72 stop:272 length:201 start_codon:yes stop_codon:yes gene_type:complete